MINPLAPALAAEGPHPSLGAHARTYGRLIGSWKGTAENYTAPGGIETLSVEVHFGWVLDGRAVQDVWICPARPDRAAHTAKLDFWGTTLRVFEPASESWRVLYWNMITGGRVDLEGRAQGDDVVQLGLRAGRVIRWMFNEVTDDSFLWQGHVLDADGVTWQPEVIMRLRRR